MGSEKKTEAKAKRKLDKESFRNIMFMFRQYWKVLFLLIVVYVVAYVIWSKLVVWQFLVPVLEAGNLDGGKGQNYWWLVALVAIFQGLLFSLDGWVTSLLKTPFNQMCYEVNRTELIADNKAKDKKIKTYIVKKATESNEHCKETLKKFGILTISVEVLKVFLKSDKLGGENELGKYASLLNISYLIPLIFAANNIWQISRTLKKIKKKHGLDSESLKKI